MEGLGDYWRRSTCAMQAHLDSELSQFDDVCRCLGRWRSQQCDEVDQVWPPKFELGPRKKPQDQSPARRAQSYHSFAVINCVAWGAPAGPKGDIAHGNIRTAEVVDRSATKKSSTLPAIPRKALP